ncbi:MAG: hypothetical protein ACOCRX_11645 [Candidatus Woesearchaeota archaeon]
MELEKERVNITISKEMKDWFNNKADAIGIPMSSLMSMALDTYSKKDIELSTAENKRKMINVKDFIADLDLETAIIEKIEKHISSYNVVVADSVYFNSDFQPELYLLVNNKIWMFTFITNKTYSQFFKLIDIRSVEIIEENIGQEKKLKVKLFFDANEVIKSTEDNGAFLLLNQTINEEEKENSLLNFYETLIKKL